MKYRLVSTVLTAVVAATITGCAGSSGGEASDPAAAFGSYLSALSDGDYDRALALVASPGGISADAIVKLGDVTFAEPVQAGADLESDATRGHIAFEVGALSGSVGFSKVEGTWKLDVPLFITPVLGDTQLANDMEYLSVTATLPDGTPVSGDQYTVVFDEATYDFAAEYDGGTRFEPVTYVYATTYTPDPDALGAVEVDDEGYDSRPEPAFTDAYSREIIAALPDTVVDDSTIVASSSLAHDATYEVTVDEIAESDLNACATSTPVSYAKLATVMCEPTQITITFVTDFSGFTGNMGYPADAIGMRPHAAGTSFTYTTGFEGSSLVLRLADDSIPGDLGDPRGNVFEYFEDLLAFPVN